MQKPHAPDTAHTAPRLCYDLELPTFTCGACRHELRALATEDQGIDAFMARLNYAIEDIVRKK